VVSMFERFANDVTPAPMSGERSTRAAVAVANIQ